MYNQEGSKNSPSTSCRELSKKAMSEINPSTEFNKTAESRLSRGLNKN